MQNLNSLDLTWCRKVTEASICNLLETRYDTLSELRLEWCHQLEIVRDSRQSASRQGQQRNLTNNTNVFGRAGQSILISLKRPVRRYGPGHESSLTLLDLRSCGGHSNPAVGYPDNDAFVRGLGSMKFEQKAPGFFLRPAQWNSSVKERVVRQLHKTAFGK